MIKVSLYLDKRKPSIKNDNAFPVKLVVYDSKTQTQKQIRTGEYQKSKKLNMSSELSKQFKTYKDREDYCNKHMLSLDKAMRVIKNGYREDDELQILILKEQLAKLEKRKFVNFEDFVNNLIEEKKLSGKSVRHFEEAVVQIRNYYGDTPLGLNDITYDFLRGFETYKRKIGKGNGSGIKKTIRTLRTVFNEAKRRGKIHVTSLDPFDGLDIKVVRKERKEVWNLDDLIKLFNFEPKESTSQINKTNMKRVIDIFLFQIAIGGHDLADVANLKWDNIKDERIRFQRFKLRSQPSRLWVDNLLSQFAQMVINKYGTKDNDRIFSFFGDPETEKYRKQNGYQLKTLNRITNTLGIPKLGTKSPRYIFRSLGGRLGVNELLLNQMMAHKPSNVSHRYQKNLSLETQDEEHKNILNLLFNNHY